MDEPIRIALVHSARLIREGMGDLLGHQPAVRVIGTFAGASEAQSLSAEADTVLLYDLATAREDGPAAVMSLRQSRPRARILFFNVADDDAAIIECVRIGASGCVLEDASVQDLVTAVRSVCDGTPPLSPRVITTLFSYVASLRAGEEAPMPERLTPREQEILALMAEGLSNKDIAERLVLQPQTVKNYAHLILQKLGLHSRLDLIRALRRRR